MSKQVIEGKQKLIENIQQKLQQLRRERAHLQSAKYPQANNSVKQNKINNKPNTPSQNLAKPTQYQKLQLKATAKQLKNLYEAKKQLNSIGIIANDPTQIHKFYNDPKWIKHMQQKKKKAEQNKQKMSIINQEMEKTKQFLNVKKVLNKNLAHMQEMHYRNILKQKQQKLKAYDFLVLKKSLDRVQKQELIDMTFDLLKQWDKTVRKSTLKKFLFSNPEFCQHFYITQAQISRDLEVYETKQDGSLDSLQLFEFIKSIQVTNPNIQPGLARKIKADKLAQQQAKQLIQQIVVNEQIKQDNSNNQSKQKLTDRQMYRKLLDYLRKVFKNIDRANEAVVQRNKFVATVEKGMYLDASKDKHITVQNLKDFCAFIALKTKQKGEKDYYKQLDSKFINFGEVDSFCKQFCLTSKNKNTKPQEQFDAEQLSLNYENSSQNQGADDSELQYSQTSQQFSQIGLSAKQGKQITLEDYQRYGWHNVQGHNGQKNQVKTEIRQLDEYYNEVTEKYGNQVAWNGFEQYKVDFKQLEIFIKQHQYQADHHELHKQSHLTVESMLKERQKSMIEARKRAVEQSYLKSESKLQEKRQKIQEDKRQGLKQMQIALKSMKKSQTQMKNNIESKKQSSLKSKK